MLFPHQFLDWNQLLKAIEIEFSIATKVRTVILVATAHDIM
jgi:hypothetical protein